MNSLLESMGLLCLAIKSSQDKDIGRTILQKMIYFADRYLDWDVGDYKLYYYGPYSRNVASTLKTIKNQLITENIPEHGPYEYNLTKTGVQFIDEFIENVCDEEKTHDTNNLFQELSNWSREELEVASTIDYVQKNNTTLNRIDLLQRVHNIKVNFSSKFIDEIYDKWKKWTEKHDFNDLTNNN